MKTGLVFSILLIAFGAVLLGSSRVYPLTMTPGDGGGGSGPSGPATITLFTRTPYSTAVPSVSASFNEPLNVLGGTYTFTVYGQIKDAQGGIYYDYKNGVEVSASIYVYEDSTSPVAQGIVCSSVTGQYKATFACKLTSIGANERHQVMVKMAAKSSAPPASYSFSGTVSGFVAFTYKPYVPPPTTPPPTTPPSTNCNLTIIITGQGTTSPAAGTYMSGFVIGQSLTVQASPASGWEYLKLQRNGQDWTTSNPGQFLNLAASETVNVVFIETEPPPPEPKSVFFEPGAVQLVSGRALLVVGLVGSVASAASKTRKKNS